MLGRSTEADLELAHVEISRQHCRFTWDGEQWIVEDLGSSRGTKVNGVRIYTAVGLTSGDEIVVGPANLEFSIGEAPELEPSAAEAEPVAARMLVRGQPSDRIEVNAPLVLGRDAKADVVLNDPSVSRRHAQVRPLPNGGCVVADLNSSAGSFVNGHRFDEHELTVGDRLQVGPFCFQFDGQALVRVENAAGGSIRTLGLVALIEDRALLDDVSLTIPASRFVGIIGPSGAGKSSLLNRIAGLCAPDRGVVLVDGEDIYATDRPQSFGFVPQEDIVHPELTVFEALRFSARLRLPRETPRLEVHKLIVQTMDQLGLRAHADKPIHCLSGGQRKRVSVGVELLARPSILFLDEPSSGLDPATEFQLMEVLRDLADTGCTIVCTTHVMENAYLIDQLVILVGGCLAFVGSPQEAREYFGVPKLTALYDRLGDRQPKEWRQAFTEHPNAETPETTLPAAVREHDASRTRRAPALGILLQRQWAILKSDPRNFAILVGQPLIIAGLVSWVSDDQSLLLFFAYLATLWFGCSNAAQEIVKEIAIYRRERLIGVGAHAYLTSKFLFLTAITGIQALLLFGALLALERGLDGSAAWQGTALLGTALAAVGIGSAISAMSRSVMQAVMIVPLILIPLILFSGFTVPAHEMTPGVHAVGRFTPTFAAQTMMDTSFLWKKPVARDVLGDHWTSFRNLNRKNDVKTGEIFTRGRPAQTALATDLAWAVVAYFAAWLALKRRERG